MKLTTSTGRRELERLKKTAAMIGVDHKVLVSRSNRTSQGQGAITTGIKGVLNLMAKIR
jgi:hypothetical protein